MQNDGHDAGKARPHAGAGAKSGKPLLKRLKKRWRRTKRALARSDAATGSAAFLVYHALRFVGRSQRPVPATREAPARLLAQHPGIVALWHGQHLLAPLVRPASLASVALLSRSADAEINARVVERFGIETERGSGGRADAHGRDKGGARALIALKRKLQAGRTVVMIADVVKAERREAGLGIVTLARISGRPILPCAAVTSRRFVVASSWDRTTIPLPFGRIAVVVGDPIAVPADADEDMMQAIRRHLTDALDAANRKAASLADARP